MCHSVMHVWVDTRCVCLQLCDGATAAEKERWSLKAPQEFHYLNQSSCYNLPRVSNAEEYRVMLMICAKHCHVLNWSNARNGQSITESPILNA